MTKVHFLEEEQLHFSSAAETALLSLSNEDADYIGTLLDKAAMDLLPKKDRNALVFTKYEIHYKHYRIIFKVADDYLDVIHIVNRYAFPPNGTPVYERT